MTKSIIAKNEPKNSNVKTFKKLKKLKNLNNHTTNKYRERWVIFKKIICGYSCWNLLDNFRSCKKKKKKWEIKESNVNFQKSKKKKKRWFRA